MPGYDLTDFQKGQIVAYKDCNLSYNEISQRIMVSRSTIASFYQRYMADGNVLQHKRQLCGRHCKTTAEQDKVFCNIATNNPFTSLSKIQQIAGATLPNIPSTSTICRRLRKSGLPSRSPAKKCKLTEINMIARYTWAEQHLQWNEEWQRVIFTDESSFQLNALSRQFVRRPSGKRYTPEYVCSKENKSVAHLSVWAAISWKGISELYVITGRLTGLTYRNEILKGALQRYCQTFFHEENYIFQQDNCPCHTSSVAREYLEEQKINCLDWPSVSPDLSPIENFWGLVKVELAKIPNINNTARLRTELANIFNQYNNANLDVLRSIISSMPRRCEMLIQNNGGHLKY